MDLQFWNWSRKKPEPPPQPQPVVEVRTNPKFVIELMPDQNIHIISTWPEPRTVEEAENMIKDMATTLYMVNTGELLPAFQQSVEISGNRLLMQALAKSVIDTLQTALDMNEKGPKHALVVDPRVAFARKDIP